MVFRSLRKRAGDLRERVTDIYDSAAVKVRTAYGLAEEAKNQAVEEFAKHPTAVKAVAMAPLIYLGAVALMGAADAATNATVGDDGMGIRDGIIRFLNAGFVANSVKIYGVADGQDPVRIAHGSYNSKSSLDFLVRDFQTDAFPKYMVEAGGNVYIVTDEQLASGDGVHVIGEAAKASGGNGGDGGPGFWCGAGLILTGVLGTLGILGLKKYFKNKAEAPVQEKPKRDSPF